MVSFFLVPEKSQVQVMRRFPEFIAGNFNYKNYAKILPIIFRSVYMIASARNIDYSRLIFFIPLWTNLIYYNNHQNTI